MEVSTQLRTHRGPMRYPMCPHAIIMSIGDTKHLVMQISDY